MVQVPQSTMSPSGWEWSAGQVLAWEDGDHDDAQALGAPMIPGASGLSDQALEALFRTQWGLPTLEDGDPEPPTREQVVIQFHLRDEDDFSEEEWAMVRMLRTTCKAAVGQHSSQRKRRHAVQWLFVNGTTEPKHHWSFHVLCEALRARPWVIQTMIHHLWFRRALVPDPLPFLADVLPEALQSESILCAWDAGESVMAQVWAQPGSRVEHLKQHSVLTDSAFERAVSALLEAGLLGQCADRLWVSSRPSNFIRPGQRVSWSRSFPGDWS